MRGSFEATEGELSGFTGLWRLRTTLKDCAGIELFMMCHRSLSFYKVKAISFETFKVRLSGCTCKEPGIFMVPA
jgi:hypothetical protein